MSTNSKAKRLNKSLIFIFPALGAALSAAMNGFYGWQWDPYTSGGAGLAIGALVMDGVKPALAPAILSHLRQGAIFSAIWRLLVLIGLVAVSAFAAFSFISQTIESKTGPADEWQRTFDRLYSDRLSLLSKLDRLANIKSTNEVKSKIRIIKATPVKMRRGRSTIGAQMKCDKVGEIEYGDISETWCPRMVVLQNLQKMAELKERLQAKLVKAKQALTDHGPKVDVDPGASRAASLLGIAKDDMRTSMLVLLAMMIEIIATFGFVMIKPAAHAINPVKKPKTVHEWLTVNADRDGTLNAGYNEISRALNISRSTAWRHAKKLIDAGIIDYDNGQFSFA